MATLAANMEWLYTEAGDKPADRVRAAAADGFTEVEIWTWKDKDLPELKEALDETGVKLLSMIVDPQLQIADPSTHAEYLKAVEESVEAAHYLNCPNLVVVAQQRLDDVEDADQLAAVLEVFTEAAKLVPEDITVLLEPLNDKEDHPGTLLTSTVTGLDIVEAVGAPNFKLLLDAYHALMMDEDLEEVVGDRIDLVGHVQIADVPGRHEPGTGTVDWGAEIVKLQDMGYPGSFGLEYMPTVESSASVKQIKEIADAH